MGDLVSLATPPESPVRPADRQIVEAARARGGVFAVDASGGREAQGLARRLRDLERAGLVAAEGPAHWKVPPDLLDRLGEQARDAPPRYRLVVRKEPLSLKELLDVGDHGAARGAVERSPIEARWRLLLQLAPTAGEPASSVFVDGEVAVTPAAAGHGRGEIMQGAAQRGRSDSGRGRVLNYPSEMAPFTGRVHGTTIDLDVAPNQPFEGKRVRVVLELVDDDVRLPPDEQVRAWSAWLKSGPDGPIEDDGDPEFP